MKKEFLRLYLDLQCDLLAYILSMGIAPNSAGDVMQNAAVIMLKKFDQFEPGTNFRAWAYTVVRYEVLKERTRSAKRPLQLSEEAMDSLQSIALAEQTPQIRIEALIHCIDKLSDKAAAMVGMRYIENMSVQRMAGRLMRSAESIYTGLSRIKKKLHECIRHFEKREAWVS